MLHSPGTAAGQRAPRVLVTLNGLRALAAMLVLVFHTQTYARTLPPDHLIFGGWSFGFVGIDIFFVLSAFLLTMLNLDSMGQPGAPQTFVRRRLLRVLPFYWLILLVKLGLLLALQPASPKLQPAVVIGSFLLLPQQPALPLLSVSWTLTQDFIFYGVCLIGLRYGARWFWRVLGLWLVSIMVVLALVPLARFETWPMLPQFLLRERNLGFILGCLGAYILRRQPARPRWRPALLGLLGLSAMAAGLLMLVTLRGIWPYGLLFAPPALALVWSCAELELSRPPQPPTWASRILLLLGDAAYVMYLIHYIAFGFLELVLPRALWPLVVIGLSIAVHLWVERPLLRLSAQAWRPRAQPAT